VPGPAASGPTVSEATVSEATVSEATLSQATVSEATASRSGLSASTASRSAVPGTTMTDRPGSAGRRVGYGAAALVNLALVLLVNGTPGWRVLPFLTADTVRVLPLVNLALVVGMLVNLLNAASGHRWARAAGGFVSSTVAVMMLSRIWDVFPFALAVSVVDWPQIARVAIGLGIVACVLSMVVQTVVLVRIVLADGTDARYSRPGP
jgi:hypothetical protein